VPRDRYDYPQQVLQPGRNSYYRAQLHGRILLSLLPSRRLLTRHVPLRSSDIQRDCFFRSTINRASAEMTAKAAQIYFLDLWLRRNRTRLKASFNRSGSDSLPVTMSKIIKVERGRLWTYRKAPISSEQASSRKKAVSKCKATYARRSKTVQFHERYAVRIWRVRWNSPR